MIFFFNHFITILKKICFIIIEFTCNWRQILNCKTKLHLFKSIIYKQIVCLSENQKNGQYLWLNGKKKLGYWFLDFVQFILLLISIPLVWKYLVMLMYSNKIYNKWYMFVHTGLLNICARVCFKAPQYTLQYNPCHYYTSVIYDGWIHVNWWLFCMVIANIANSCTVGKNNNIWHVQG